MKILGLHSVSFDQPIESRKAEETYENSENEQLKKIRTEINELNDGENTANDKIEIQGTLNKEFAEFLKNKPEIAKQLWDAVSSIKAEEGSDNAKAKADLLVFLKPIINPVDIKQDITDLNEEGGKFYEKNLDKSEDAITKVKSTINDIFGIIGEEAQEGENENITKYRNTINNIKKVLDKPNETNTKSLQKFILANLDGEAKDAFLEGNFRKDGEGNRSSEAPDGLFGQATLNGVSAFLIKLEEHVNNIKGAEEIMSNNKKPIEPEGGLTGQVKTETTKTREQPIDTTPLYIKDGKYKGTHQVRTDSQIVCQNAELNGATFYSLSVEGQESGEAPNESGFNGLMRLSNSPDEIFRVKIDKDGYLCPVIENCNSGKRILVKNNPSCISYLQKKIPDGLPGNPIIVWNSKLEDYAIRSDATNYREGLTIEPMEIDGHGVSPDLSELLVMMNFVNYLRFNKKIDNIDFDNNDPDLRLNDQDKLEVRVDRKSNRTYDEKGNVVKNGRWYEVPDRFGLSGISPERIKNLIKFNNGEDWRDKWDKKKGNKYYDKMTLPKTEIQTVNPATSRGGQSVEQSTARITSGVINNPRERIDQDGELRLRKSQELKKLLENVDVDTDAQSINRKEIGIMMMLMCDKADDFISKVNNQGSDKVSIFNEVRTNCLTQLDGKGGKTIRDVIEQDHKDSGSRESRWNLANYITITDGENFIEKYKECGTPEEKSALVETYNNNFSKTWGSIEGLVYNRDSGTNSNAPKVELNSDVISTLNLSEKPTFSVENKKILNIPENATVYTKDGDVKGVYYKNGDSIICTSFDEPWIKKSIPIDSLSDESQWTFKVDVFEGGRGKLQSILESEGVKDGLMNQDMVGKMSIVMTESIPKEYQLKYGESIIPFSLDDFTKNYFGKNNIEDKLKVQCLFGYCISELKAMKSENLSDEISIIEDEGQKYLNLGKNLQVEYETFVEKYGFGFGTDVGGANDAIEKFADQLKDIYKNYNN